MPRSPTTSSKGRPGTRCSTHQPPSVSPGLLHAQYVSPARPGCSTDRKHGQVAQIPDVDIAPDRPSRKRPNWRRGRSGPGMLEVGDLVDLRSPPNWIGVISYMLGLFLYGLYGLLSTQTHLQHPEPKDSCRSVCISSG